MNPKVLIIGSDGQLGQCFNALAIMQSELDFVFTNKKTLDITNFKKIETYFSTNKIDWCINCAAYTAVDNAENNTELAEKINVTAVKNLALVCKKHKTKLIHISTDFVFDGNQKIPYKETDTVNPQNIYGRTKRLGELELEKEYKAHFIIRTSWLYSEFGHNFLKTMLRLASEKESLEIVADQIGSPTYGKDLAKAIFKIIVLNSTKYGIYNYSNKGEISWFDFAKAIFEISNRPIQINPIQSKLYPTLAKRPKYSVLNTSKIEKIYDLVIPNWKDSLEEAISNLHE